MEINLVGMENNKLYSFISVNIIKFNRDTV